MAFLDKLGGIAKNIGDKASDSIETTKLGSKIKAEKSAIGELYGKIGEHYYELHQNGQAGDPGAANMLAAIDGHNAAIAEMQAEIARIQAAPAQEEQAPIPMPAQEEEALRVCAACGAAVPAGMKFCGECGGKVE